MELGLISLGDRMADPRTGHLPSRRDRQGAIIEQALRASQAGFGSVWLGEHHFSDWIISAPEILLAAIAAQTSTLRLGTGVTLLPIADPVRVAESFATLDVLSGGRVDVVAGRGILVDSYRQFGFDYARSREQFEEKLDLLVRLWTEQKSDWKGEYRVALRNVTVEPRPVQHPHPPLWVAGGSSSESVDLAARLGLPLMLPSVFASPKKFVPMAERYRERYSAAGHDPSQMLVGGASYVFTMPRSQDAVETWRPYLESYYTFNQDRILASGASLPMGKDKIPFSYEALLAGPAVCGSPAQVADRLKQIGEMLSLDVHLLLMDLGGLPQAALLEEIDLIGQQVIPQLGPTTRNREPRPGSVDPGDRPSGREQPMSIGPSSGKDRS